ncbi:MAG TPA: glycoside hydrolase family 3 N-terminal domain-containing protein [Terriglobales bacterium]|nr:glycoside hydrolase family 3 N-terminal domain-containing protein [Terriglobales bacterium]
MRRLLLFAVCIVIAFGAVSAQEAVPDYRNPKLPPQQRTTDLLHRMTLEEKIVEISGHRTHHVLDTTGKYNDENASKAFRELYDPAGTISPRDAAILRNAAQRYQMEKTRLGIPALFQGEALHGFMEYGSTSFPQVLGLASTWDPDLVFNVFTAASDEMSSAGVNQAFTPVLDLARDPRWGRTEETYGEDPFLVSRMGVAAVEGLQGTNYYIDRHHVIATAKHFAGHGQPEGGRNAAPVNISERILRETFFEPFQAVVQEANVGSVMASYHEIDGVPSHINGWLLTNVLRGEWGFRGYITSDGNGLQMLYETHGVAAHKAEAARKAIAAGIDYDLSDGSVYQTLLQQVQQGIVPESDVDRAVYWVLFDKFRAGLFDDPYVDPDHAAKITNSPEHQKLALKAAQESIVLLKNQNNLLPLDPKKIKTIAVLGPNAADVHLGGYSRDPGRGVSILQGIKDRVGPNVKVLYAEGCKITLGKEGYAEWYENDVKLPPPGSESASVKAAAELAKKADVAIVVVGENEGSNREAWAENHLGDRDSLDLLGEQTELVKQVVATGVPTIVFLINGRPLSINYVAEHVPAIVEGWYLGQEGGTAAANVLFGDVNPGGKLPITFPRSVGQLPDYYDHKPSRNRSYAFVDNSPLFPFGFGLSYTTFKFDNLRVEPTQIRPGGTAKVSVDITNTGTRQGDEVPQMYIHQRVASVTQPVMQLRGFERITLKPGEKKTVEFSITPDTLAVLDINMNRVVEPGTFDIMVGPSSTETTKVPLEVIAK